jgi:broad specificity phosphatase PhoE
MTSLLNHVSADEMREIYNYARNNSNQRTARPGTTASYPQNHSPGAVPQGDGPVSVRGSVPARGTVSGDSEAKPDTGSGGKSLHGLRLVTGSADPTLTPVGIEQAKELRAACRKPFDHRFNAPNTRSRQTMIYFGKAIELPELSGWPRGEYEGRIAHEVKEEMARLIENPDEVPPGKSPVSGQPGKSWNQSMKPMFERVMEIIKATGPNQRSLIITSGGQLQAFNIFAKAGYPANFEFDHKALAKEPYWSVTGQLFIVAKSGLSPTKSNESPGCYMIEHTETYWNYTSGEQKS